MPDEPSLGEVVRRLDRLEAMLRELGLRVVSVDLYTRDRAEIERRLAELERDLQEEREARRAAVRDVRTDVDEMARQSGTNVRQAIYSGLIPGVLFLISLLITIIQSRSGA